MQEIWWIRHGETDWNLNGRVQGTSDIPLNATGRAQAAALAERFDGTAEFDGVYASDLERAAETARLALPDVGAVLDARLQELDYGHLEGHRWADPMPAELVDPVRAWQADPFEGRVPGGESYGDLTDRVAAFLAELPTAGRFALFSHGGTIRSALYAVIGRPRGEWRIAVENTSITRVRFDRRGATLVTLNDHGHLDRFEPLEKVGPETSALTT
ncbi:MAG: histidine phosphatase family protein [Trueperaceae bacterium]|nr:histidine phosphatase family protein [Trueperaceae bacterium]